LDGYADCKFLGDDSDDEDFTDETQLNEHGEDLDFDYDQY